MAVTAYIFWLALAEFFFYISGFIVQSAAGHILGPADYGVYGIIITLTILIASLIGNGIPIAMSKFLSADIKKNPGMIPVIKRKGAIAQFILMTIVTLFVFIFAPLIAELLHDPSLTRLLRIGTLIIPCYGADAFYFYYYTGIHQFNMQSILKTARSFLRVAIIVGLGYFLSLEGFITGYIYVPLVVYILAFLLDVFIYSKKFPKFQANRDFSAKKLLLYALPVTGFLVLYQTMISLNLFVVKSMLQNDYLTGIFNGAFTVSQIPNYLFYALTIILLPVVSHSTANEERVKTAATITKALRFMTMLLFPVIALIIGYARPLMIFFFGADFAQGDVILQPLAFGIGLLTLFYVMSFAFQGAGLVKIPLRIAFLGMLLNVSLNIILVNMLGVVGSGIATIITSLVVTSLMLFMLRKALHSSLQLSVYAKFIFASVIIFALSFILPGQKLFFILSGAILYIVYFVILFALKELTKDDILMFKEMIPGLRKKRSA